MKPIRFNKDKDKVLKEKRGIGFKDVIKEMGAGKIVTVRKHPNTKKFPSQKIMLINIKNYIFVIPYIETEKEIFLKTIYKSRKYTKEFINKKKQL